MTNSTSVGRGSLRLRRSLLCLSTILCTGLVPAIVAAPASAQVAAPAPVRQSIDGNGVDLFLGTVNVDGPTLSAGQGEPQGLTWKKFMRGNGGWGDTVVATLTADSGTALVSFGGTTDRFSILGGAYTSTEGNGATLSLSGTVYTYTASNGTVAHFDKTKVGVYPYQMITGLVTDVTRPNGATLTYTYFSVNYCSKTKPGGGGDICQTHTNAYRIASAQSNSGYKLIFDYAEYELPEPDVVPDNAWFETWGNITGVSMTNTVVSGASTRSQTFSTSSVSGNSLLTITDPLSRVTTFRSATGGFGITRPGKTSEDITYTYDSSGRVATITTPVGTTTYAYADASGVRTTTVTDPGGHSTVFTFEISTQLMKSTTNPLSQTTSWTHDSKGRILSATAPESNKVVYTYDADDRGNVVETRVMGKGVTTPSVADLVTTAGFDATCSNAVTCNQPNWTKDAKGNQTDYTYDSGTGNVLTVTAPAPVTSGTRPKAVYTYTTTGGVSLVSSISSCQLTASCTGTADETKTTVSYNGNLLPSSVTKGAGDGSLTATTTLGYDDVGNRTTIDGPLSGSDDTTTIRYNADREVTGVISADPDSSGSLKRRATRATYNERGIATVVELGTVTGTTDTDFAGFSSLQQVTTTLDDADRKAKVVTSAGGSTVSVAQYSYDSSGRLDCSALRMKPGSWSSLPTSACTAATGSGDDDRISRVTYDNADRILKVTSGYGLSIASDDFIKTYSNNGLVTSLTDGENNKTTYVYDSFDRLSQTQFPDPVRVSATGTGSSLSSDYEELSYDSNGNITSRRLRDNSSIAYAYDNLDRVVSKNLPGSELDVTYTYDLLGRPLSAATTAQTLTFTYDALGRNLTQGGPLGTVSYQYDLLDRRTRMTWPDTFYVTYDYDMLGQLSAVKESGSTTLTSFTYDDLGRRIGLSHGNGVTSTYSYDAASQLTSMVQNLTGTSQDLTLGFSYNKAGQIVSTTRSNDSYAWTGAANLTRAHTLNGLNQYSQVGGWTVGYDARGNLTSMTDGVTTDTYSYSSENLLLTGPNSATLSYDPFMRLSGVGSATFGTSQMLYDGQTLIGQSNASGTPIRRYVVVPGTDEVLVEYKLSNNSKTWKITDNLGSVLNATDASGNGVGILTYDEYGIPATGNSMRYQFTGQIFLSELGMYYYKARMYSPTLGRFMQTDPIGYGDGMNWHNYVGGDPINNADPTGTLVTCRTVRDSTGSEGYGSYCDNDGKVGRGRLSDVPGAPFAPEDAQPTDSATGDIIITSVKFGKNPRPYVPTGRERVMLLHFCMQTISMGGLSNAFSVEGLLGMGVGVSADGLFALGAARGPITFVTGVFLNGIRASPRGLLVGGTYALVAGMFKARYSENGKLFCDPIS